MDIKQKKRNPLLFLTNITELSVLLIEICLSRNGKNIHGVSLIPGSWLSWKNRLKKANREINP